MSFFDSIKEYFNSTPIELNISRPNNLKAALSMQQVGVTGRAAPLAVNREALDIWSRRNELVFACLEKIKQAAIDPTPIIEKLNTAENFEPVKGHPLSRLLARPNPLETGAEFWGAWLASEHIFGEAYAEIERNGAGSPIRLWLLNPKNIRPIAGYNSNGSPIASYEYTSAGRRITLKAEDVLVRRNKDLTNQFYGLSPLAVALGAVDMDTAQTDFVRAFFNNGGVPSGLLRFPNSVLTPETAEEARQRFMAKYGKGGKGAGGVAVLDQNAEYQKVGANLNELESDSLRGQSEARICSCFGVPPILVGAYVAILHLNQRASAQEAQKDFWVNKMSPLFKGLRQFLTWRLLPEFENIALIEAEKVRVGWDMSRVMALQEDTDKRHDRARRDFQSGLITLNEARAEIGQKPDESGSDYYLRPSMAVAVTPEVALIEAEKMPANAPPPPKQLTDGKQKSIDAVTLRLKTDLIGQAEMEAKGDFPAFALVPPPKYYEQLYKLTDEQKANELIAEVVRTVEAESLRSVLLEK